MYEIHSLSLSYPTENAGTPDNFFNSISYPMEDARNPDSFF